MILFNLFEKLSQGIESIIQLHQTLYIKIEAKILEEEENQRFRIKKSILLYNCYLTVLYFVINPIINHHASRIFSLFNILMTFGQIYILRGDDHSLIGNFAYIQTILSVLLQYFLLDEPLTIIGLILANQLSFFLFPENKLLERIYIPSIIILLGVMQRDFFESTSMWDEKFSGTIKSFFYSCPLTFFLHYYGAKNLITCYRLKLIDNMEIQTELQDTLNLLEKSNQDLKEALQSRELFIASVSHELRNPLNCLIGNIELLRLDVKNEKWIKTLDTCKLCSEVLLGQINNVLDVAKINAEKLELHYLPENFSKIIDKVWKISSISIQQKKLKGDLKILGGFPKYIKTDSHRLTQILLNLIGNATKFVKNGGVTVIASWHEDAKIVSLKNPSQEYIDLLNQNKKPSSLNLPKSDDEVPFDNNIHLSASSEYHDLIEKTIALEGVMKRDFGPKLISRVESSDYIESISSSPTPEKKQTCFKSFNTPTEGVIKIEVIDTGCGISQEALRNLFQPFKQADSSITRRFGGTGLGLYITKQIVEKMGGEIVAFSHENYGSDFCVLIPVTTVNQNEVHEEEEERKSSEENIMRSLIVDDNLDNQMILKSYFKKLGIQSEVAGNGLEALKMFKEKGSGYFNFITMDLQMPGMDGLNSCEEIRKYEKSVGSAEEIPILIITGNCNETQKNKCLDKNGAVRAFNFFRKPFTFDECKSMVQLIVMKGKSVQREPVKVLIVDDDGFNLTVTKEYLQRNNFVCKTCASGAEAINSLKSENYDVILMDCEMPEMDGFTTTSLLKKIYPNAYVIGVTGNRREECLRRCLDSGMSEVETKPVDFKKLINSINHKLSRA